MEPIAVEQQVDQPIQKVWDAITVHEQMKQWYFENIPAFEAVVGFTTRFAVQAETREFVHLWKVIEVNKPYKIAYSWKYEGIAGDSVVVFELAENGDGTKVKLTHTVIDPFPTDIPEFARENGVAGWEYFIKVRLNSWISET